MRQEFITKAPVLYTPPPDTALRSTCSHDEGDEIGEKPDPAHAKCASQAILFFAIPCFGLKGTGFLIFRALTKDSFSLSCELVLRSTGLLGGKFFAVCTV